MNATPKLASFDQAMTAAVALHQAGDAAGAERAYRAALAQQPRNGDALRLLGGLYLQANRYAEAQATLRRALTAQPGNPEILNNLGVALREQGATAAAIKQLRRALAARPAYPEALNNLGSALQAAGRLADAIAQYAAALRLRPGYVTALRNLGIALRVAERPLEAIAPLEQAAQLAPTDAPVWGDLGLALHRAGRHRPALAAYERALALQPANLAALVNLAAVLRELGDSAGAIYRLQAALLHAPAAPEIHINLGAAYWDLHRLEDALASYAEALRLAPGQPAALTNRGAVLWASGRLAEAAASYRAALAAQPGHAEALTGLGAMAQETGTDDAALALYEQALAVQPGFPPAAWRKSLILLARGDYAEGWRLHEAGANRHGLRGLSPLQAKAWAGGPVKRLLIWSEQGLGDSLQFVRYAALCRARAERVIVLCPQPLLRLYRSSPSIDAACDRIGEDGFDAQASLMSLPHLFGTTLDTVPAQVPYLAVDPAVQGRWDARLPAHRGPRVGLVWAGHAREGQVNANRTDRRRSLSLAAFHAFLAVPRLQFYNLQKGPPAAQLAEDAQRGRIVDLMPLAEDFMDTAALINRLDLVITVDTSVAHLAGALGRPVWLLSRYDACWRWLRNRADSPWYPTARVFGQPAPGDWDAVIATVTAALAAFADKPLSLPPLSG